MDESIPNKYCSALLCFLPHLFFLTIIVGQGSLQAVIRLSHKSDNSFVITAQLEKLYNQFEWLKSVTQHIMCECIVSKVAKCLSESYDENQHE